MKGWIAVTVALAGLALVKLALDALDQPSDDDSDWNLATEYDGFITEYPPFHASEV